MKSEYTYRKGMNWRGKGEKAKEKVNIYQIAEMAQVSPTTVMNVLHGRKKKMRKETFERVERIIAETGYVKSIAPALLSGRGKHLIGVIVGIRGLEQEVRNQYAGILFLLEKEAFINDYYVLLHVSEKIDESIYFIKTWKMEGVFTFAMDQEEIEKIQIECGVPVQEIRFHKIVFGMEKLVQKQIKDFLTDLTNS